MSPDELELYRAHARIARLSNKIARAQNVIRECLAQASRPYVAFSGGKDSLTLLHLVHELSPQTPAAFFDDGAQFPDTYDFVRQETDRLEVQLYWVHTEYTMLELYQMTGMFTGHQTSQLLPGAMKRVLIEDPARTMAEQGFDAVFMGLRAAESYARLCTFAHKGEIYQTQDDALLHCIPLATWSARDVWGYIASEDLVYNAVYDKAWEGGRENIRVGSYAGSTPGTLSHGRYVFMKRHYPDVWREFVRQFPGVARYA